MVHPSHPYMTTGKTIALTIWTFVRKVMSLLYNMLSRLAIVFLPRRKHLVISWLPLLSTLIFGAQENKVCHCFHFSSIYLPWSDGTNFLISEWWFSFFECWVSNQLFSLSSFTFINKSFSFFSLSAIKACWYFLRQSWFQLVTHPVWHFT